jgi:hypothetical protein
MPRVMPFNVRADAEFRLWRPRFRSSCRYHVERTLSELLLDNRKAQIALRNYYRTSSVRLARTHGEAGRPVISVYRRRPRQLEMLSQKGNDNQHGCHGIGPLLAIIERLSVPTVADGQ